NKQGVTMSADELAELDKSDKFGDILGTGAGRNWAHVNSVDYDPTDDSIIVSSRHQSAIIKIGRDKKVKWIIGSHQGWKAGLKEKLLTPVDKNGKRIKCDEFCNVCEQNFDWTWT
ncbi:aryl-sulfate sulfotransferase, partial [Sutterella massiliensis]